MYSINPAVEEWGGKLWGITEVQSHGELTQAELDEVISELTGQFLEGWGEGFEQRAVFLFKEKYIDRNPDGYTYNLIILFLSL